ncbi:PREDICTED: ubiquitin thioesterase OTUB1 [Myotis davidii]|uniref:ubiquitin thioesterase OTUB1 n=1 Tax=Myotis davidii TaxID=225400 RepID=UPI0007672A71|nr:PREDICTED: ubiquitin thioesterase OTUB1 [Myotis davidii]
MDKEGGKRSFRVDSAHLPACHAGFEGGESGPGAKECSDLRPPGPGNSPPVQPAATGPLVLQQQQLDSADNLQRGKQMLLQSSRRERSQQTCILSARWNPDRTSDLQDVKSYICVVSRQGAGTLQASISPAGSLCTRLPRVIGLASAYGALGVPEVHVGPDAKPPSWLLLSLVQRPGVELARAPVIRGCFLLPGVNCLAYDEAIMAQQDRIQQEIAVQNPLVSERLELSVLYKEYAEDDNIYQQKIKDLHKKYSYIRKTRPDGNCFYRAFGFSHLEALLDDSKELQRFKAVSAKSKEDLVSQGFTEFTIEDFHNTFMDLIEQVEKQTSVADLLASFNDQSTSDYLVVYLRLLTSGYLQRESKFFEHFIEGGRTVKEFCQQEVEPMCKESDHIHNVALAQALNVSIQVEYMDRGEGTTTNPHIFPEGSEPKVYLLYRPGHYDILYKEGWLCPPLPCCPPLCQALDMYRGFCVVVNGHISLPLPCHTTFTFY